MYGELFGEYGPILMLGCREFKNRKIDIQTGLSPQFLPLHRFRFLHFHRKPNQIFRSRFRRLQKFETRTAFNRVICSFNYFPVSS